MEGDTGHSVANLMFCLTVGVALTALEPLHTTSNKQNLSLNVAFLQRIQVQPDGSPDLLGGPDFGVHKLFVQSLTPLTPETFEGWGRLGNDTMTS